MKTIQLCLLAFWISSRIAATAGSSGDLIFETIRNGDAAGLRSLLLDGTATDVRDDSGATPLMRAALAGDEACLQLLLDDGADPKAGSRGGVTPLMWAVRDLELVRRLLKAGADPNQVSRLGNSPLILAARIPGNHATVELLLKSGSKVSQENFSGIRALQAAAASADLESVKLLLAHGAEVNHVAIGGEGGAFIFGRGQSALVSAARQGDETLARLLISKGADVRIRGPLIHAAMLGRTGVARLLLEHGAKADYKAPGGPGSYPALMWAVADAGGERRELVKLLLEHGANPEEKIARKNDSFMEVPQSAILWAEQHGDPGILKILTAAGASHGGKSHLKEWRSRPRDASAFSVKRSTLAASVGRAVPLLEKTALESYPDFKLRGQSCISCHQQLLPMMALGAVRDAGLKRDEEKSSELHELIVSFINEFSNVSGEPVFLPAPSSTFGYFLRAMSAENTPSGRLTDGAVHVLASFQRSDGSWSDLESRPPISGSDVEATALSLRGLQTYPIPGRRAEFGERIERAANWLRQVSPRNNEERTYQLLGLAWAGEGGEGLATLVKGLLATQRSNGGWAQLEGLESDAYATGQAIYSLLTVGKLTVGDPPVQRGLQFLLATQTPEGSWHVRRRAYPFQPTFHSAFPHGRDAWISAAATSWAVMAMSHAFRELGGERDEPIVAENGAVVASASRDSQLPAPVAREVSFEHDIKPLLQESCLDCHGGTKHARSKFRMDTREALLKGGLSKTAAVKPGHSASSPLIRLAAGMEEDLEMPPLSKRDEHPAWTEKQIALVRKWIDQGAEWPDGVKLDD